MSIENYLDGYKPDPETKRVMGVALEMAHVAIARNWGDAADAMLAKRIIELAKAGEHNPDRLCEEALKIIGKSPYAQ